MGNGGVWWFCCLFFFAFGLIKSKQPEGFLKGFNKNNPWLQFYYFFIVGFDTVQIFELVRGVT